MSTSPLTVDVYVAPMRPFVGAPAQAPGDEPMWSPMSSTLIAGATEAILVDTLVTINQVDALAEWVRGFGKRITGVYITHGHSDHWIGLARLQDHFPEAAASRPPRWSPARNSRPPTRACPPTGRPASPASCPRTRAARGADSAGVRA